MRKVYLAGSFIVCCTTILVFIFVHANQNWTRELSIDGASLSLSNDEHDLGITSAQQEWPVWFKVRNAGSQRLVIREVDRACCCGEPVLYSTIIQPGESEDICVVLSTRTVAGHIEKIASYKTNDPLHPGFDLSVRAYVPGVTPIPAEKLDSQEFSILILQ